MRLTIVPSLAQSNWLSFSSTWRKLLLLTSLSVIGKISFQAPDEGTGTDAILVSAAIQARAEGDHSSSSNATSIDFLTGASEAAAKKLSITSAGHFIPSADNTNDIGTASLEFKDGYFDGTLHCDVLDLNGTEHTSIEDPTALAIALG